MKKKAFIIGAVVVLFLWAVGGWWLRPRLEQALTKATQSLLADPIHTGAFSDVKLSYSGQEAILEGRVASQADRERAGNLVAERVSVPGWGSSFNPVWKVTNRLGPSGEFAKEHQQPWLLAVLANGAVTLTGVLPTEADKTSAGQALSAKLVHAPTSLVNKLTAPAGARPAVDLAATLKSVPDLAAAALADPNHAVLAYSTCDGRWSPVQSAADTTDGAIILALGDVHADGDLIASSLTPLRQWQADEARKKLLAAMPAPVLALGLIGNSVQIEGNVGDEEGRLKALTALTAAFPGLKAVNHLSVVPSVRPDVDFSKVIADNAKKLTEASPIAVLKSDAVAYQWDGKGTVDDLKKSLTAAGADAAGAQALWDALEAKKKAKAERDAKAAAEAKAAEEAKAAAEAKAKMEAEAKAKAAAPTSTSAVTPSKPAPGYIGWTMHNGVITLFGVAGTTEQRDAAVKAAQAAFPGGKIVSEAIRIDPARQLGATRFPEKLDSSATQVWVIGPDGTAQPVSSDAFDSEIAQAFPGIPFAEGELSKALLAFRSDLVKSGKLTKDEPYLTISSDGKVITAEGELADAATKDKVLAALKAASNGLTVSDKVQVSPLVTAVEGLAKTLDSLPKFTADKSMIVSAKPGQKAREGVVHGIYFKTGSNRSVDQDRALAEVRRIVSANPSAKFEIVGNTDNVGAEAANIELSKSRADNVVEYLTANGIAKAKLSARGAGPNSPIADNSTDAGKAANRRVDVLLK